MGGSSSAALVCSVHYYPLASLIPPVLNCLPGFPLEHCVLHLFDVVVPPIMVLFREMFHCGHKVLDLSLQCGGSWWLVSLNVVSGSHRASEYHATLVSGK